MIWNGTTEGLTLFIDELNKKHKNLKLDCKIPTKQIEFLDTIIYRDLQHKIQRTIFRKLTDEQTYFDAQSNHPKSLKDSIPYSQALKLYVQLPLNSTKAVTSLQKDSKKEGTPRIW